MEELEREIERLSGVNQRLAAIIDSAPDGYVEADAQGKILLANREAERMLGYGRGQLQGRCVDELVPRRLRAAHAQHRARFGRGPLPREMGAGRHLVAQRSDGSTIAVEIRLSAMETVDGPRFVVSIRDVGERRRQKEQLQRALKARDTLLREVYHRVKNNLQVVSSLLRWHARSAGDRPCAEVLEDAQARIHAMAIVHETLANAESADEVDFASYVRELVRGMQLAQQGQAGEIDVRIDIDDRIGVPLDRAVPCGLIVHELVSNAFEHAFPESFDSGDCGRQVRILLERSRHHLTLVVADNGIGMPSERRRGSLGLEIVRVLARQVGGDLIFADGPGTRVEVRCRRMARA